MQTQRRGGGPSHAPQPSVWGLAKYVCKSDATAVCIALKCMKMLWEGGWVCDVRGCYERDGALQAAGRP